MAKKKTQGTTEETSATTATAESEPGHTHAHEHAHEHDHEHGHHHHHHDHDHDHDHDHEETFEFVEEPTFEVDYKGDCAYEVKVSVPPANRAKQADTMFEEIRQEAMVPGFRKGRAPRQLIERKFAKHVRAEVDGKLISAAFEKLIKEKKFNPIAMPDIEGLDKLRDTPQTEPLSFTLKFEVSPKVELGKYRGVAVDRPVVTVDENDINEAMNDLRARYGTFESVDGAQAQDGDQVIIDFQGTVDGQPFVGGTASDYPYILGTKRFFTEFETALNGSKAGATVTCEVTLPETNPNENLRGKKAEFTITVKEIKRRTLPELNDDFAKQVGADDIAALKERMKKQLQENSSSHSDRIARARALDAIIESSTYEIPKSLIDNVAQSLLEDRVQELLYRRVPMEQIEQRRDEMLQEARKDAMIEIKRMVTLNEIAEAEGIETLDDDFETMAHDIAARTGIGPDVVSRYMLGERRSTYESRILREKALNVVMEHAVVTEKEVPREELEGEANAADA